MREVTLDLDGQKTDVSGCTRCGGVWISQGDLIQIRRYLRRRDVAADGRIGGLELKVDEAQREADDFHCSPSPRALGTASVPRGPRQPPLL